MKITTAVHTLILLALLSLLQGCGFHLRGTGATDANLPADISPLYIQGLDRGDFLKLELENLFVNLDIQVSDNVAEAASILRISDRKSDRRVQTVNSDGKVAEYQLRESLRFELADRGGDVRVPEQLIELFQIYTNQQDQVLGSLQEESNLREDMWRRMSDQMIRRLSVQLR